MADSSLFAYSFTTISTAKDYADNHELRSTPHLYSPWRCSSQYSAASVLRPRDGPGV